MKALLVHGVGFHEAKDQLTDWVPSWINAMTQSAKTHTGLTLQFSPPFGSAGKPSGLGGDRTKDPGILYYEDLIRKYKDPDTLEYIGVVSSLLASGATTAIGDLFRRDRGIFDIPEEFKWKAREVAAWACNDALRAALRKRVIEEIRSKDPEIVIAHSYGGLITYDACLFGDADLLKDRHLITLGTQIGNPLLRREFGGYQLPVRCRHWFNLFNPHDKIFVSSLEHIHADNFTQIVTPHDVGAGHDGATYLSHPDFATLAWPHIVDALKGGKAMARGLGLATPKPRDLTGRARGKAVTGPNNRALLIGIDSYENPSIPTLQGCVNDTFELSASLQEAGIDHREIRMVHNAHATRKGLLNHIGWLLEDARPGDHRFLSFSGHGHRRPSYGPNGEPLEMHEILCTHDYNPSTDSGLKDSDMQDLYANLPRGVYFTIFLGCCHAGGIPGRSGGPAIRSFYGPSDIEHESSKWNSELEMWEQGPLLAKDLNPSFLPPSYHSKHLAKLWQDLRKIRKNPALTPKELHQHETNLYYGSSGDTRRIGRASQLRDLSHSRYDSIVRQIGKLRSKNGKMAKANTTPSGPYLPLIFMACGETESANEYVHGAVSYGAFTYAFTLTLRSIKHRRQSSLDYGGLLVETARKLHTLGYTQTPDILGPPDQLTAATPFAPAKTQEPVAKKRVAKKITAKKAAKK